LIAVDGLKVKSARFPVVVYPVSPVILPVNVVT
jgi:hypothetical protein